jgi:hypothetical protein
MSREEGGAPTLTLPRTRGRVRVGGRGIFFIH